MVESNKAESDGLSVLSKQSTHLLSVLCSRGNQGLNQGPWVPDEHYTNEWHNGGWRGGPVLENTLLLKRTWVQFLAPMPGSSPVTWGFLKPLTCEHHHSWTQIHKHLKEHTYIALYLGDWGRIITMRLRLSGLHRDPVSGKKHLDSNFEVLGIKMALGMLGKYSVSELCIT